MATGKENSNPFMAGKTIVISEDVILKILQLDDAKGVVCLRNEEIFAGLAQIGYEKPSTKLTFYKAFFFSQWKFLIHTLLQSLSTKRTSWNEFSMAMASAAICLSIGQKFNFSKYIFDSLNQVGDLSTHTTRFISPALTQNVFANMRWVGKGFSGVETPLFEGILAARQLAEEQVQADYVVAVVVQENVAKDNLKHDKAAQKLEIIKLKARVKRLERANKVKSSMLRRLRKVGASKRIESSNDMEDVYNQGRMIDDLDKDEGIELVVDQVKDADIAKTEGRHATEQAEKQLITDVVTAASQIIAASATISDAKPSIPAAALTVVAAYTRRRKGVIIRDLKEELSSKTPAETPKLKDKGKDNTAAKELMLPSES
nr:hypothetical protein [Tanacetum cinerariifolium]